MISGATVLLMHSSCICPTNKFNMFLCVGDVFLYTRKGRDMGNPQSTIKQNTQSNHTHSNAWCYIVLLHSM